jgi:hypothetical protein
MEGVIKKAVGWSAVAGVAIFGGVSAFGDNTTRNENNEIVGAGGLGVFSIEIGDCLNLPSEITGVQSVEGVPCSEEHGAQAFAKFDLTGFGDDFPGSEAFNEQASAGCTEAFDDFVGISYEQSALYFMILEPSEETWEQEDDREVVCLIIPETGTLDFDARNSGR